jgi:hypothetical protein
MNRQILNGWKEISGHIGRSVRTVQCWEVRLGMPVYWPAQKDRSAVVDFSDELDRWISRASPAREVDVLLNNEIVFQVLTDMASLVGNTSERASQMELWPEPLPRPIEFHRPRIAPTDVSYSEGMLFGADVGGFIDERRSAAGMHNPIGDESSPDVKRRSPGKKTRYKG